MNSKRIFSPWKVEIAKGYARDRSAILERMHSKNPAWSGYQQFKEECLLEIKEVDRMVEKLYAP